VDAINHCVNREAILKDESGDIDYATHPERSPKATLVTSSRPQSQDLCRPRASQASTLYRSTCFAPAAFIGASKERDATLSRGAHAIPSTKEPRMRAALNRTEIGIWTRIP